MRRKVLWVPVVGLAGLGLSMAMAQVFPVRLDAPEVSAASTPGDEVLRLPGLTLADDNGKVVGEVVSVIPANQGGAEPGSVIAVMRDGDSPVLVEAHSSNPSNLFINRFIAFELLDCGGLAYFDQSGSNLMETRYGIDHRQILYRRVGTLTSDIPYLSWMNPGAPMGGTGPCANNSGTVDGYSAEVVVDLDTVFNPPYHLQ